MSEARPDHREAAPGILDRLLGLFSEVFPGEGRRAFLMLLNVFLILVAYYIIKTVREPLILAAEVPGFLQALGITGALDGHPLDRPPLELWEGWPVPDSRVMESGRVGVGRAADWPLRFFLRGHPQVSSGPRGRPFQPSAELEHG